MFSSRLLLFDSFFLLLLDQLRKSVERGLHSRRVNTTFTGTVAFSLQRDTRLLHRRLLSDGPHHLKRSGIRVIHHGFRGTTQLINSSQRYLLHHRRYVHQDLEHLRPLQFLRLFRINLDHMFTKRRAHKRLPFAALTRTKVARWNGCTCIDINADHQVLRRHHASSAVARVQWRYHHSFFQIILLERAHQIRVLMLDRRLVIVQEPVEHRSQLVNGHRHPNRNPTPHLAVKEREPVRVLQEVELRLEDRLQLVRKRLEPLVDSDAEEVEDVRNLNPFARSHDSYRTINTLVDPEPQLVQLAQYTPLRRILGHVTNVPHHAQLRRLVILELGEDARILP